MCFLRTWCSKKNEDKAEKSDSNRKNSSGQDKKQILDDLPEEDVDRVEIYVQDLSKFE